MNTVFVLLSIIAATPLEVSVTPMRGETVVGMLDEISSRQLVLTTPTGNVTFKAEELLLAKSTRVGAAAPPRREDVTPVVMLVDGTVLHAAAYSVQNGRATVALLDGTDVTVSTRAIAHVRLLPQTPAVFSQWQELLAGTRESDAIVIRKTAGAAEDPRAAPADVVLDAPEGVLGDIDSASVGFEFDGSSVKVPLRKVQGVIYFHPPSTIARDPLCRVIDTSGSSWHARSLKLDEDQLEGITVSGVRFAIPLQQVDALDYSVGNIDYLSDLPRESVVWRPRRTAGTPPSAYRWFSPKFDTGLYGSVLKLEDQPYEKGLALHSHAEVTYRLTKRYRNLFARVGVDEASRYEADLELQIYGDNDLIFSRKIKGDDEPFDLELDMEGVRRLKIVVGYGDDDSERGDNLNLCNARLTK